MHSDVWGAIDEQLLPRDIDEEVKQQYHFIDIGWIGWVTIQQIFDVLQCFVNKTLTNLDLSDNGMSEAGATSIAEATKFNKTLTNLNLFSNGISNAEATSIAEATRR